MIFKIIVFAIILPAIALVNLHSLKELEKMVKNTIKEPIVFTQLYYIKVIVVAMKTLKISDPDTKKKLSKHLIINFISLVIFILIAIFLFTYSQYWI